MKTVENAYIMLYNKKLYNIGGVFMDRITQSMIDAFKNDLDIEFDDIALIFE